MSFLKNLVSEFAGGDNQQRGVPPPPEVPYPWRAIWEAQAGRYLFVNEQTGQRTFDFPQQYAPQSQYGGGGGYGQGQSGYGQDYPRQGGGYGGQQGGYEPNAQPSKNHHYGEMALAGAAGLAGGAVLMHEGEKVHNDYEEDKYRVEGDVDNAGRYVDRKWDNGVQDLEDAPEDAARWTGEEVQRVEDIPDRIENRFDYDRDRIEDIPDRIENRFDNDVDRVEDIPDDVAGWAGRETGQVERFDDGIDNAYDQGRDDERYDDRRDDY